ncbi:hypothetical protein HYC85_017929 [Camellia sinensis]|uniref:DUF688 domain-containing protein n=1 Tax=Camellia sinensis TaxID=4442 RepID=A0A7J7GSU5_CAMSI|nr:hypothetical protein HYC85_017929 [Camellia sinensis]
MEKKQLDLDAPLLSVRRFSSALVSSNGENKKMIEKSIPHHRHHSLPSFKSEWELAEVTKPVAVPFLWEQIPGRPKGGSESEAQSPIEPSNTPRLPPGRAIEFSKPSSEKGYKDQNATLNKGVDTDSEYDEYSDALDMLSPTETLSMNSRVSGSDAKPCGTYFADMQTRDFMMNRFLPAAKAMDIESEDEDDEDDEYDSSGKTSVKGCGLFSQFCFKNSLCLLNPVPGMKPVTHFPITSAKEVSRLARTAYSGPRTQIADKHAGSAVYKPKFDYRAQSHELHKVKSKLTIESHRLRYSDDLPNLRGQGNRIEDLRINQGQDQQSMSLDCSRLHCNAKLLSNNEHILKADDQGSPNVGSSLSSLPPPLPKSPSESWLCRTLPSISFQHPLSHSGLGTQFHHKMRHAKVPSSGTKWENIVKTSNGHHDHVRCSKFMDHLPFSRAFIHMYEL